jgi:hypothetical protein
MPSVAVHTRPLSCWSPVLCRAAVVSLCCVQASYALGYNLAIEYLADYEKTWMLDSFRDINSTVLNKDIDWIFLEVR